MDSFPQGWIQRECPAQKGIGCIAFGHYDYTDLDPASDAYDVRVRSAAAFLMAVPRFQEQ